MSCEVILPPPPSEFNNAIEEPQTNPDQIGSRPPSPMITSPLYHDCPSTSGMLSPADQAVTLRRVNSCSTFQEVPYENGMVFRYPARSSDSGCALSTGGAGQVGNYQLMAVAGDGGGDCRRHSWSPKNVQLECCGGHHHYLQPQRHQECGSSNCLDTASCSVVSPSQRNYRSTSPLIMATDYDRRSEMRLSVEGLSDRFNRSPCNSPMLSPTSFKAISPGANDLFQVN